MIWEDKQPDTFTLELGDAHRPRNRAQMIMDDDAALFAMLAARGRHSRTNPAPKKRIKNRDEIKKRRKQRNRR